MAVSDLHSGKLRRRLLFCFILLLTFTGLTAITMAADTARNEFQGVLQESLAALWTGQEFSSGLSQRQRAMKDMLNSGAVSKADLETMMGKALSPMLAAQETSRYVLKTMPERANSLFSPVMEWEAIKKLIWGTMAAAVKTDAPVLLTIGTLAPPGTPWLNVPETILIPEIEKLSNGRLQIKIYGGGVMGEDTDILNKMKAGQLDGCGCTALGVLEASPEMSALLVPGLFTCYEEIDYIIEKLRKRLDKAFAKNGYILAGIVDTGYCYLFTRNKVTGLTDFKKQNVANWFGVVERTFFQELGINPVPVAVPDMVSSFASGTVDVVLAPAAWMLGMQAYQYANFYLTLPLVYSPTAVFVTTQSIERVQKQISMSAAFAHNITELIISEIADLEPEWNRQIRSYEAKSLKAFESKCGMKAMAFSPEDQGMIRKSGKAVQKKLAGKTFPADLINDIQKALDEYRAQH